MDAPPHLPAKSLVESDGILPAGPYFLDLDRGSDQRIRGVGEQRSGARIEGLDLGDDLAAGQARPHNLRDGLHLGLSSAINVAGAERLARHLGPGKRIVTILCDNGSRYLSTIWNPDWLAARNLPLPPWRQS